MTNDPNSPKSDIYTHKLAINQYQKMLDELHQQVQELCSAKIEQENKLTDCLRYTQSVEAELSKVINSKGWQTLEKIRKFLPTKKTKNNNIALSSKKNQNQPKIDLAPYYQYHSHYEDNIDFSKLNYAPEVKAIAFYLPQFHTIKENDKWWGKGFTEWTNTKKAKPCFPGHYQPREPHDDIGYYTLDNIETIKNQINLAKQHGIYGFCFYYYWFSGKRLLEKPVDLLIQHPEIDFPFCLCWANENWTRTWDGLEKDVLIAQKYQENDPENFIRDLKKYIDDKRYIKIDNKPLLLVYNPDQIPDFEIVVEKWRKTAKEIGIGDIYICSRNSIHDHLFKNVSSVDAEFDFAPLGHSFKKHIIEATVKRSILDYSGFVQTSQDENIYYSHTPVKPFYYSCTLGWDNSPRRKTGYTSLTNYSPEKFYEWLHIIIEETKRKLLPENRFIFINAWNEWGEGTYLEPDKKFGYTNINTVSKAIFGLPYQKENDIVILDQTSSTINYKQYKIAVQLHVYYLDLLDEALKNLSQIPYKFDLFISTNSTAKKVAIENQLNSYHLKTNKAQVMVIENIGRDVYPFFCQLANIYHNYNIIGHFHTKKTITSFYGDEWRKHIFHNLLDSAKNIECIFSLFNDSETGLVIPTHYYAINHSSTLGSNTRIVNSILKKLSLKTLKSDSKITFPVGNMFWARTESIEDLFKLNLTMADFPEESGQVDGTTAHALERLIGIVPEQKKFKIIRVINKISSQD